MRRLAWLLLGVGIWVGLVVGCAPVQQEPQQRQESEEQEPQGGWELPPPDWESTDDPNWTYVSEGTIVSQTMEVDADFGSPATAVTLFVDNQVLIAGNHDDITEVIEATNAQLGESLDGEGLRVRPEGGDFIGELAGREFWRYKYSPATPGGISVLEVVTLVKEMAIERGKDVTADPNYVTTAKMECFDAVGSPLAAPSSGHGEPSPGHGEPSPLHGTGSPFPYPGIPLDTYFWQQWALTEVGNGGIAVSDGTQRRTDLPVGTGTGVQVTILDTSPFASSGHAYSIGGTTVGSTFDLEVVNPFPIDLTTSGSGLGCLGSTGIANHGLFVAGLAHAVAPDSDYKLVRVLGNDGLGDLGGILYALVSEGLSHSKPTVFNLSLGIVYSPLDPLDKVQVAILDLVTGWLNGQGDVVTVAAAGNHSSGTPREPQLPARYAAGWDGVAPGDPEYPTVLAVAASVSNRDPAFYSHKGSVGAPGGGDNDTGCATTGVGSTRTSGCWNAPEDFVVSITATPGTGGALTYSLGYWIGTSFATPLVAGMAAVEFPDRVTAELTADAVRANVCPPPPAATPVLGAGIIGFCQ